MATQETLFFCHKPLVLLEKRRAPCWPIHPSVCQGPRCTDWFDELTSGSLLCLGVWPLSLTQRQSQPETGGGHGGVSEYLVARMTPPSGWASKARRNPFQTKPPRQGTGSWSGRHKRRGPLGNVATHSQRVMWENC